MLFYSFLFVVVCWCHLALASAGMDTSPSVPVINSAPLRSRARPRCNLLHPHAVHRGVMDGWFACAWAHHHAASGWNRCIVGSPTRRSCAAWAGALSRSGAFSSEVGRQGPGRKLHGNEGALGRQHVATRPAGGSAGFVDSPDARPNKATAQGSVINPNVVLLLPGIHGDTNNRYGYQRPARIRPAAHSGGAAPWRAGLERLR